MRNYTHNGYEPYGVGEMALVDFWADSEPWDQDCDIIAEALANGCTFVEINEYIAHLITPTGRKIHFVKRPGYEDWAYARVAEIEAGRT